MASIQTTLNLTDNFSSAANSIIAVTDRMVYSMKSVKKVMGTGIDSSAFVGMRSHLSESTITVERLTRSYRSVASQIDQAEKKQESLNNLIQKGGNGVKKFIKSVISLPIVQKGFNFVSDQLEPAMDRMDTAANYQRTMTVLTGSPEAAEYSLDYLDDAMKGTAYHLDTATDFVHNFVSNGMGVESATKEAEKWMDAVSFFGNGTNEEYSSVTEALSGMLSKGKVDTSELDRLKEVKINAVDIYAKATGRAVANIQKDLNKGKISSMDFITTVSTAFEEGTNGVMNISGASKNTETSWEATIASTKEAVARGLADMIESINIALENAGFPSIKELIQNLGVFAETTLGNLGGVIGSAITVIAPLVDFIREHNDEILKAIQIVASLAVAFAVVSSIIGVFQTILSFCSTAMTLFGAQCSLVFGIISVAAIAVAAVALYSFIEWVKDLNKKTGDAGKTAELVFKKIEVALANLNYVFSFIIGTIQTAWNIMCLGLQTVFCGLLFVILGRFYLIASSIRNYINDTIDDINFWINALNCIPGVNIQTIGHVEWTGVDALGDFLQGQYDALTNSAIEVEKKNQKIADDIADKESAAQKAQEEYDKLYKKYTTKGKGGKKDDDKGKGGKGDDNKVDLELGGFNNNSREIAENTARTADTLSATSEDLKYIRDMAEQKYINRFTTSNITVNQTNNNSINKDMDLDGITEHLRFAMEEQMSAAAEGAH